MSLASLRKLITPTLVPLAATIGVIIITIFALRSCHTTPGPKIPERTQREIDSLANAKPAFEHVRDSIIRIVVHDTIRATIVDRAAERTRVVAAQAEHRADSLATMARAHTDSAILWRQAYDARTVEADTLRLAVAQKDSALRYERDARVGLSLLYGADTLRRVAVERVNADLVKAIKRLEQPCRIIGPIPCPSRTVTAIVVGSAAAVAGWEVGRRGTR